MRRPALALLAFAWAALAWLPLASGALAAPVFDPVVPGKALEFPRDYGAHPGYRIEWWYVTGHLDSARGPLGFQVTFFRVRNPDAENVPGRFSPRQVLFAHAALADVPHARFLHDQRIGRALPDLVEARVGDTGVRLDDWMLARESGGYHARVSAEGFALDLLLTPTQPVLLQGDRGYSRKGPLPEQASYYYSEPQLRVEGKVSTKGEALTVGGVAWLDHEWSSELLASDAAGWDWLGANLDGGGALTAFRIRATDGRVLWATSTYRAPGGDPVTFTRQTVEFTVRRTWKSPRTGTEYPVAMDVRVADRTYHLEPLLEDQELDARASTGTLYWEGAVRITGRDGVRGRGYLELTGYAERVPF
jgi:predicted secreted hydrolase